METTIEIDNYNKYPVGGHEWEVNKETKTIQYKLYTLTKGMFFGHEEIIYFNRNDLLNLFSDFEK